MTELFENAVQTIRRALSPAQQDAVARFLLSFAEDDADCLTIESIEADDMAWAKPYVDEARASIARGEGITLEEHQVNIAALLESLKNR